MERPAIREAFLGAVVDLFARAGAGGVAPEGQGR